MNAHTEAPRWVMNVPVLSTAHLPPELVNEPQALGFNGPGGLYIVPMIAGFMVFNDDSQISEDQELPLPLRDVLKWAIERDFEWVRFDRDGDLIEGLRTYEHN